MRGIDKNRRKEVEMTFMKPVLMIAMLGGLALDAAAQDQCKPIGWATRSGRTGGSFSVTGGGSATPIVVTTYADLAKYAGDATPRVIHVNGILGAGWAGTSGDRLEIKSNKTIIGMKPGTNLKACIHIKDASNVILRNIVVNGPGSNTDQAWDNINIEGASKNIWVDHCEFWDGQDGNSDAVKGADNITYTWSIFGYRKGGVHNLSNLIASSDNEPVSAGKLNITFMGCWFRGINQRGPRCRYGNVHVVNNLYTTDGLASQYAVSAGFDCQVITENNVFVGTSSPIYTGHKAGTSAHYVSGNVFEGTSGNQAGYGSAFPIPYDKSFVLAGKEVKAAVQKLAGATLASPAACGAGSTDIASETMGEGFGGLLQERQELLVGFADQTVEVTLHGVSGNVLRRWTLVSSGASRRIDLSGLSLRSGLYFAVARSEGRIVATSPVQLVR